MSRRFLSAGMRALPSAAVAMSAGATERVKKLGASSSYPVLLLLLPCLRQPVEWIVRLSISILRTWRWVPDKNWARS